MTAIVKRPGKPDRKVKNLGWLNRHAGEVDRFTVTESDPDPKRAEFNPFNCKLIAHLNDGGTFEIGFASRTVCWMWLASRRWASTPLNWFGKETKC